MFACLIVCLCVCLFASLLACLLVCLFGCLFVCLFVCMLLGLFVWLIGWLVGVCVCVCGARRCVCVVVSFSLLRFVWFLAAAGKSLGMRLATHSYVCVIVLRLATWFLQRDVFLLLS